MRLRTLFGLLLSALPVLCASTPMAAISARSEYLAEVWDTDRGLPNYGVTSVTQTPDGYLWVATYGGLARFDGVTFQVIHRRNTPEFPGYAVTKLYVDRHGLLWAATDNGVVCLRDGHWRAYPGPGGQPIVRAADFVETRDGTLRVKVAARLLTLVQDAFVEEPIPAGITALRALRDQGGDLWLTGDHYFGVWREGNWHAIPLPPDFSSGLTGAGPGSEAGIWLASSSAIHKFQNGAWLPPIAAPPGFRLTRVVKFLEDSGGNLWVGDYVGGVFQYRKDGRLLQFTRAEGLPNLSIRWLFEDREKNIWVGTDGGGLVRLRPRMVHMFDEQHSLNQIVIDSVHASSTGGVLTATYGGGLVRFNPAATRFSRFPEEASWGQLTPVEDVLSVIEDRDGSLWAGTLDGSLFHIRGRTASQIPADAIGSPTARALLQDSRGTLWIGTNSGVASYDGAQFHRYDSSPPLGVIGAIAEVGRGEIWAGGAGGLFRQRGAQFQKFLPAGVSEYAPVDSLYAAKDGSLWVGVTGRGLDRLRDGGINTFGPAQGLPASTISGMMEDEQGRLWLATGTQGLLCIPLSSFDAVGAGRQPKLDLFWLKKEDGLATNNFRTGYQPTVSKGGDGRLWFATLKGLAMVDTPRVRRNPVIPPVRIEAVGISGQTIPVDHTSVVVPAGSHGLKILYTALSFAAPERVRFQYQLEGMDAAWIDATDRSASFGDLRPGDYTFRVRAANNDGVWNPDAASLKIHVTALLWETWWFRALAAIGLAAIVATSVYSSQRRKLRKEKALRRDVERLQDVLKISEERFSKAFEASPFPLTIATVDEARFLDVNASFLERTGLRREEVIGHTRAELGLWDDEKQRARFYKALEADGRVRGLDVEMRDRNGQLHHLIVSAEVIELNGVLCLLSASDDITERKQLEEQLSQAQKLESVGRLAGGVAHDFNNMLTVINGYSDLLLKRLPEADSNRRRVEEIRQAGRRAAELTQQLLAFSRRQVIQPAPLNLNALVGETEKMLRRLLPENIEMVTQLDPALWQVMADPGQIHQVLMNLALNARDAMPAGGKLIMETANVDLDEQYVATHPEVTPGPFVRLSVTDTGLGMDESVRSHIFEPFFTTKATGAGTGLGLATVYGIVRQSEGWIRVFSEPGKGTSFKIYLPRVDAAVAADDGAPRTPRTYHGTETVLLVEDRPDVRRLAKELLDGFGYHVLEAGDGAAALELAAQHPGPIHLLLTDVVMPGMTGRELAERLKAPRPETKVLYMSGYTEDVMVHQGILKAGIAYVAKPLTADELGAKVRETLG